MIETILKWSLLFMPPILASIRLVFVAKYLRNAKDNTFTDLAKMTSLFVGVAVLFWIGQIHTNLYGSLGEGGWGFLFAVPALLFSAVFLELMVVGSKVSKQNDDDA